MNPFQKYEIVSFLNKPFARELFFNHFNRFDKDIIRDYIFKNATEKGFREQYGDKMKVFEVILPDNYKLRLDFIEAVPNSGKYNMFSSYDIFTPKGKNVNDSGIKRRRKCCRRKRRSGSKKRRSGSKKRRSGSKKRRSRSKKRY